MACLCPYKLLEFRRLSDSQKRFPLATRILTSIQQFKSRGVLARFWEATLLSAGSTLRSSGRGVQTGSRETRRNSTLFSRSSERVITIRDIAKATGLSIATVSMVLNKAGRRIPAATQRRVEDAARKLGYSPNLQARSLRSKRTHSVGVLVFDITDPYCGLIVRGIENSLEASGYMSVISDLQNTPRRIRQCLQMLVGRRVDGIIAIANPVLFGADLSNAILPFQVPAVVIGSEPKNGCFGSVIVNNAQGTWAAFEHLYELGHREIAVIKGPKAMTDSAPRWAGIRDCARAKGIRIDRSLLVEIQGDNSSYEEGYALTERLLAGKKPFTSLLAFDDLTAFAAIGALSNAGHRIPEDCSVIGFDDIPGAAFYNPPLTTLRQHLEEQGGIGAEMMAKVLEGNVGGRHEALYKKIEPHLVVRKSTTRVSRSTKRPVRK
jgi:LacI family transcriptional regulator, galactose operon repressor